jgi:hypothetical protein
VCSLLLVGPKALAANHQDRVCEIEVARTEAFSDRSWPTAVGDQALNRAAPSLRIAAARESWCKMPACETKATFLIGRNHL